ncbi:unnamed protein product [Cylindrotheca closterium]|uniref:EF-hand domain-containing protein n=1 Tax=Cylindrotheca closterium TaxID=2856 RepID=A0AAD2PUQ8_9STRA|nr:unnamed protein product [Cylindrotheca closterium]
MVMFTKLWMANQHNNNDDNDDEERNNNNNNSSSERQSLRPNQRPQSQHQKQPSKKNVPQNPPPRTIEYGSIFAQATAAEQEADANNHDHDHDHKTVTWGDKNNNDNGVDNYENNLYNGDSEDNSNDGEEEATSNSQEADLPSLTAAFQNLENRPIIINCLIYLALYMTIAVVAYSFVLEQWTIIDSLYFAVATFTTCGYGDLEPSTPIGQVFTIFFAIYGVIILGVFIAIFGSFISEYQTKAMKKFQRKKQEQMLETLFDTSTITSTYSASSRGSRGSRSEHAFVATTATTTTMTNAQDAGKQPTALKDDMSKETDETEPIEESGFWRDHVSLADDCWKVVYSEAPLIGLVAVMSLILGLREGWNPISTMYFCIMAATTTGYGDYTPVNQLDKLYCVILLPLAVAVFGEVLGRIATVYISRKQRVAQFKFLHRSLTMCDIRNMDSDEDGKVDREDFVMFMLVALQKVDKDTIKELQRIFDSLDRLGDGFLDEADITALAEENYLPTVERIREEYIEAEVDEQLIEDLPVEEDEEPEESSSPNGAASPTSRKHRRFHTVL